MYKWESKVTGVLCQNIGEVIKTIIGDYKHYHCVNLIWKYHRKGV